MSVKDGNVLGNVLGNRRHDPQGHERHPVPGSGERRPDAAEPQLVILDPGAAHGSSPRVFRSSWIR